MVAAGQQQHSSSDRPGQLATRRTSGRPGRHLRRRVSCLAYICAVYGAARYGAALPEPVVP